MSLLEVTKLRKTFDDLVAVDDVSFQTNAGEVFGLLGPNGAGKSTTMLMIAGLLVPDSGSIAINSQVLVPGSREHRTLLGVVPQELAIYPELTARENLRFFGRLYGLKGTELKQRVDDALQRIGLTERANGLVANFSGGMKRRLNFGIALVHKPRLLILDEPTVGVDPQSRAHLLDCIRDLSDDGVAIIYASHYMEEVQAICRRVAIMNHGKMLACADLRELLSRMTSDLCLRVSPESSKLAEKLQGLADVHVNSDSDDGTMAIIVTECNAHRQNGRMLSGTLTRILELLKDHHVELEFVETHEPNLERLFLEMTGNRLRD